MIKYFNSISSFAERHGKCMNDAESLRWIKRLMNGESLVNRENLEIVKLSDLKKEMLHEWDIGPEFNFILETWVAFVSDNIAYRRGNNAVKDIEMKKIKKICNEMQC